MKAMTWTEKYREKHGQLLDFLLSPFSREAKEIKRISKVELSSRRREEWQNSWRCAGVEWCETVLFLRIIKSLACVGWPCEYFIPDDTAALVMGYFKDQDMDNDDVFDPLLELYGIDKWSETAQSIDNAVFCSDCTLGEFWKMICDNREK